MKFFVPGWSQRHTGQLERFFGCCRRVAGTLNPATFLLLNRSYNHSVHFCYNDEITNPILTAALQVKGLINKEDSKPPPTVSPLVTVSPVVQTKPPKNSTVKPAYITPVTSHVQVTFTIFNKWQSNHFFLLINTYFLFWYNIFSCRESKTILLEHDTICDRPTITCMRFVL